MEDLHGLTSLHSLRQPSNIITMSLSTLSSHSLGLGEWGGGAGGGEAGGLVKAFSKVLCI